MSSLAREGRRGFFKTAPISQTKELRLLPINNQALRITVKREIMKKEDINTLDDLKVFLTAYQEENPEDDCCELVRDICKENGWIYTDDSSIGYDEEDFATDGEHILSLTSNGFEVFLNDGQDINYNGTDITVREDDENFYVNFNTGLGEGIYPKADWTLDKAIKDQENIYKENK